MAFIGFLDLQLITENDSFITETCMIFGFLNIGLLGMVVTQPRLTMEQRKAKFEYLHKLGVDLKTQKKEKKRET